MFSRIYTSCKYKLVISILTKNSNIPSYTIYTVYTRTGAQICSCGHACPARLCGARTRFPYIVAFCISKYTKSNERYFKSFIRMFTHTHRAPPSNHLLKIRLFTKYINQYLFRKLFVYYIKQIF